MDLAEKVLGRWAKYVDFGASPTDCWIWRGGYIPNGYGSFALVPRKQVGAHRVAWLLCFGTLPDAHLHHRCHVRACVNPFHLEEMSAGDHLKAHPRRPGGFPRQTVCKNGHPLEGDNLLLPKDGRRRCKACAAERQKRYQRKKVSFNRGGPDGHKTHCKHGHPWIEENIYVKPANGHRSCRICEREQAVRRREKKNGVG